MDKELFNESIKLVISRIKPEAKQKLGVFFAKGGWIADVKSKFPKEYNHIQSVRNTVATKNKINIPLEPIAISLGANLNIMNNPANKRMKKKLQVFYKKHKKELGDKPLTREFMVAKNKALYDAANFRANKEGLVLDEYYEKCEVPFKLVRMTKKVLVARVSKFADSDGKINREEFPDELFEKLKNRAWEREYKVDEKQMTVQQVLANLRDNKTLYFDGSQPLPVERESIPKILTAMFDEVFRKNGEKGNINLSWHDLVKSGMYYKIIYFRQVTGLGLIDSIPDFVNSNLHGYTYFGKNTRQKIDKSNPNALKVYKASLEIHTSPEIKGVG